MIFLSRNEDRERTTNWKQIGKTKQNNKIKNQTRKKRRKQKTRSKKLDLICLLKESRSQKKKRKKVDLKIGKKGKYILSFYCNL